MTDPNPSHSSPSEPDPSSAPSSPSSPSSLSNRRVWCIQLKEHLPGLPYPPLQGPLGLRIYKSISKKAWKAWINHVTMLINEYRLDLTDPKAQALWREHMEAFLFGSGRSAKPAGYRPRHEEG